MRTALVTGATGFIGSHLVPALVEEGWAVRACGRRARPPWMPGAVEYRAIDLVEGPGLDSLCDDVNVLFHLAGASSSLSDAAEMHAANVMATRRLMQAARRVDQVLHMSSTSVYGEEVALPQPVREEVEPQPSRGYGKAKWQAEQAVWESGLAITVLRPVSVYGPGNIKLLASAILDAAVERFAGRRRLEMYAVPVEQRLVHIDDVVSACLHVVGRPDCIGRSFNLVGPTYPTSHDVAGILADVLDLDVELNEDPGCGPAYGERRTTHEAMVAAGMVPAILLTEERFRFMRKANRNNRLSMEALVGTGFSWRVVDLETGIRDTIGWYRDHRWIV